MLLCHLGPFETRMQRKEYIVPRSRLETPLRVCARASRDVGVWGTTQASAYEKLEENLNNLLVLVKLSSQAQDLSSLPRFRLLTAKYGRRRYVNRAKQEIDELDLGLSTIGRDERRKYS